MKRYHFLIVILHWLMVPMIFMALFMGNEIANMANDIDFKIDRIDIHMKAGMLIAGLMLIRLLTRIFSKNPAEVDIGHPVLNKLGVWTHYLLYMLVFMIVASGISMSLGADIPGLILSSSTLPDSISDMPQRIAHGILTKILFVVLLGHIGASLYHQFIKKDGLFSRMWFGKR
ncbi:MAG: cytochrome b [Gammaproteobacteria bacterium]|nr:MAG: cytochrome b [Gammaproteobacteria bacterium]